MYIVIYKLLLYHAFLSSTLPHLHRYHYHHTEHLLEHKNYCYTETPLLSHNLHNKYFSQFAVKSLQSGCYYYVSALYCKIFFQRCPLLREG